MDWRRGVTALRMAQIGAAGQTVDMVAGGDVDPTSGRLLSVAQLQQALRLAVAMSASEPQVSTAPAELTGQAAAGAAPWRTDLTGGGLPVLEVPARSAWVVGVSGGCGETLLAGLLSGVATEQGHVVATDHLWPDGGNQNTPVLLCARTTMASLEAAQETAALWARGYAPPGHLVGLVLMSAAPGREPSPIHDFARILAGGVPQLWRVPWVPAWRLGPPDRQFLPRPVAAVLSDIGAAVARCSPVPGTTVPGTTG